MQLVWRKVTERLFKADVFRASSNLAGTVTVSGAPDIGWKFELLVKDDQDGVTQISVTRMVPVNLYQYARYARIAARDWAEEQLNAWDEEWVT